MKKVILGEYEGNRNKCVRNMSHLGVKPPKRRVFLEKGRFHQSRDFVSALLNRDLRNIRPIHGVHVLVRILMLS